MKITLELLAIALPYTGLRNMDLRSSIFVINEMTSHFSRLLSNPNPKLLLG